MDGSIPDFLIALEAIAQAVRRRRHRLLTDPAALSRQGRCPLTGAEASPGQWRDTQGVAALSNPMTVKTARRSGFFHAVTVRTSPGLLPKVTPALPQQKSLAAKSLQGFDLFGADDVNRTRDPHIDIVILNVHNYMNLLIKYSYFSVHRALVGH